MIDDSQEFDKVIREIFIFFSSTWDSKYLRQSLLFVDYRFL